MYNGSIIRQRTAANMAMTYKEIDEGANALAKAEITLEIEKGRKPMPIGTRSGDYVKTADGWKATKGVKVAHDIIHTKADKSVDNDEVPAIVKKAMLNPIVDIGQLSETDLKALNKFVKDGILVKEKGGPFPKLKTVYALKGHDVKAKREDDVKEMLDTAEKMDRASGQSKLWDKK